MAMRPPIRKIPKSKNYRLNRSPLAEGVRQYAPTGDNFLEYCWDVGNRLTTIADCFQYNLEYG